MGVKNLDTLRQTHEVLQVKYAEIEDFCTVQKILKDLTVFGTTIFQNLPKLFTVSPKTTENYFLDKEITSSLPSGSTQNCSQPRLLNAFITCWD